MTTFRKVGVEFAVESHTRGVQRQPQLAAFGEAFVVVWTDDAWPSCEIGGPDVKAKLFNSTGGAVGREFRVNTETIDHQRDPRIADFPEGGFVVVWQDFSGRGGDTCGSSIKAKLFNAAGVAVKDEFLVNVETSSRQFNADVATLAGGDFVVVWQCHGGSQDREGLKARLFDGDGVPAGDEILVSILPESSHYRPSVARLEDGGFVVVWSTLYSDASSIKAKVFDAGGAVVRDEFLVKSRTMAKPLLATVAGLKNGGFVVAWTDPGTTKDADVSNIRLRVFDEIGNPVTHELSTGSGAGVRQLSPVLAPLAEGGFVLAWSDRHVLANEGSTIKALVFGPKGTVVGEHIVVSERSEADQNNLTITSLTDGGLVMAWEDASGRSDGEVTVKAQIFQPMPMDGLGFPAQRSP